MKCCSKKLDGEITFEIAWSFGLIFFPPPPFRTIAQLMETESHRKELVNQLQERDGTISSKLHVFKYLFYKYRVN